MYAPGARFCLGELIGNVRPTVRTTYLPFSQATKPWAPSMRPSARSWRTRLARQRNRTAQASRTSPKTAMAAGMRGDASVES